MSTRTSIRVGDYLVDPARGVVSGETGETHVEPKVMEVLCGLADRVGEVVARTELIDSIWGERFGADESLSRAISILRKAFEGKPYIETVPKRGYCLTATVAAVAVEPDVAPGIEPLPERVSGALSRRRPIPIALSTLAVVAASVLAIVWWQATSSGRSDFATGRVEVLPFDVLADDPLARHFTAGLDSNLRGALAVGGVEAAADVRSAEDMPGSVAELTIEGSVDRGSDSLIVTAHVVHQEERLVLWSSQFQRDTDEMIALQSQVASKVAQVTRCGLASRAAQPERTTTRLFALFLQACDHLGSDDGKDLVRFYALAQRMVAEAPDLAMAHALYAYAVLSMGPTSVAEEASPATGGYIADARRAAERALEIDPTNGTANFVLAMTYSGPPRQWTRFESHLRQINVADPSFSQALQMLTWLARATGRLGDAIDLQRQASELDPYSSFKTATLAWLLAMSGMLAEADALLTRSEVLWPGAPAVADYRLQIATWYRPPDVAEETLRSSVGRLGNTDANAACLTLLLDARRGHRVEHQDLRRTCGNEPREDFVARVLALVGDVDGAILELESIDFSAYFGTTISLFFPEMRAVRYDARFMPLAHRIGLVDYWRSTNRWPDFCADPDLPYDCKRVAASLVSAATSTRPPVAEFGTGR